MKFEKVSLKLSSKTLGFMEIRRLVFPPRQILVHRSVSVHHFLTNTKMTSLPYQLHSLVLACCDLFPKLRGDLKGKRFADINEVKLNIMAVSKTIEEY